jgi:peroxiredoxin Q/BCP
MADWIQEGAKAPDFTLHADDGTKVKLSALAGAPVVLYFYPKDDTPGCTTEACEFRDMVHVGIEAQLFGVSPDSAKSHGKFAQKYDLPFPLLADTEHQLAESLGIWVEKSMYGRKYFGIDRSTYLVGPDGNILRIWRSVKPQGHAAEVKASLT